MDDFQKFAALDTVALVDDQVVIIDQTKLPGRLETLRLRTQPEIWEAIKSLRVRGAPAIGVTAGLGLYLAARDLAAANAPDFPAALAEAAAYLNSSRPTAVNLSWALKRLLARAEERRGETPARLAEVIKAEALAIAEEDVRVCRAIGRRGLSLIKDGDGLLTHCNAGRLAAVRYGTATAPIYAGLEAGLRFKVFADETRPLLQGARLTAYELSAAGLDVTLICDNMAATVMRKGWVQAVFVGCDRVAANGDTANKIGTLPLAIAARHYGVPMYVCAPTATIDPDTPDGGRIVIEERPGSEITDLWYAEPMAPAGCRTFNPAFDVTDHELVSALVTEYGVVRPPLAEGVARILAAKARGESFA
jgi:methylthioribose-1-phosphate isomerase